MGIPMGVYAALRRGNFLSQLLMTVVAAGRVAALVPDRHPADPCFRRQLKWLPSFGRGDVTYLGCWTTGFFTVDGWKHLILPAVTLAIFQLTLIMRLVRAEMLEVLRTDYIKFCAGPRPAGPRRLFPAMP